MKVCGAADFSASGAQLFRGVVGPEYLGRIALLFDPAGRPGKRLDSSSLRGIYDLFGGKGPVGRVAAGLLGPEARAVRALLLDKSPNANWALGWHQDRTIAARERIDVAGFGPWSVKSGQVHVEPPHEVTARMVTLRIHVDRVDADNAPLKILVGSHQMGRLPNADIDMLAKSQNQLVCLAEPGDVWAYSTAVVHSSERQVAPKRRRVLQVDYSADRLPGGLQWAELGAGSSAAP